MLDLGIYTREVGYLNEGGYGMSLQAERDSTGSLLRAIKI